MGARSGERLWYSRESTAVPERVRRLSPAPSLASSANRACMQGAHRGEQGRCGVTDAREGPLRRATVVLPREHHSTGESPPTLSSSLPGSPSDQSLQAGCSLGRTREMRGGGCPRGPAPKSDCGTPRGVPQYRRETADSLRLHLQGLSTLRACMQDERRWALKRCGGGGGPRRTGFFCVLRLRLDATTKTIQLFTAGMP